MTGKALGGRFRPYPRYRDSGIEWLGEVPEHWTIEKIKFVTRFHTGWTPPTGTDTYYDGDLPWANISDLGPKFLQDTAKHISRQAIEEFGMVPSPPGSLLFSFKLSVGLVSIAEREMYTNEAIATFLPGPRVSTEYLYWSLPLFLPLNADENIYGALLLNQRSIRDALLVLPPLDEQWAIAAFLDRETGKIDRAVGRLERLIELLEERRVAVIAHAVTRGLDPSVPLKDSGIEWLGEVPEHWVVQPLKRALWPGSASPELIKGRMHQEPVPGSFPGYSASGQDVWVDAWTHEGPGIVLSAVGARCGKTFRADGRWTAIANTAVFFPREGNDRDYLWYVTNNELFWERAGAAQPFVRVSATLDRAWAFPPLGEQRAIAEYLDRETGEIDRAIGKAREEIELLREYRAALVTAAVTGRIDVREEAGEGTSAA